jgi:hypothetical protein
MPRAIREKFHASHGGDTKKSKPTLSGYHPYPADGKNGKELRDVPIPGTVL